LDEFRVEKNQSLQVLKFASEHTLKMSSPHTEEHLPHTLHSTASSRTGDSIAETVSVHDHFDEPETALTPQITRVTSKPPLSRKATSIRTTATTDPAFEIDWEDGDDTENPRNWPLWYKGLTIGFISWSTWVVYGQLPTLFRRLPLP